MQKRILSTAIVLYNNSLEEIQPTIKCALANDLIECIYLIDNSPTNRLGVLSNMDKKRIKYLFQNENLGFGKAHNIALKMSLHEKFKYHLILNPDILFEPDVINELVFKLNSDTSIGLIMPKILNEDGTNQFLPKLLPSPFKQFIRLFSFMRLLFSDIYDSYILKYFEDQESNVPIISGCFCVYSIKAYMEIGGYDDRFFMYYEDFDLSRRIHTKYKTLYYPSVKVIHRYERGANKNFQLFKIFVSSGVKYFNKYGWFFDLNRIKVNKKVIKSLN